MHTSNREAAHAVGVVQNCLSDSRSRCVLTVLIERSTAITADELAQQLASTETYLPESEAESVGIERIRIRLHHIDLPKLAAAGLVQWDRTRETVQLADSPVVNSSKFELLLNNPEIESDRLFSSLADDQQRVLLDTLTSSGGKLRLDTLARKMSERDVNRMPGPAEEIEIRLHHALLPRLDEAGIVEYDVRERDVSLQT